MKSEILNIQGDGGIITLRFIEDLTLYTIMSYQKSIYSLDLKTFDKIVLDLRATISFDSAAAIFLQNLQDFFIKHNKEVNILFLDNKHKDMFSLVSSKRDIKESPLFLKKSNFLEILGEKVVHIIKEFLLFLAFFGEMSAHIFLLFIDIKKIRYKEIAFEINESAIKALGIVILTSFLIGIVVAYQAAYQLKNYGANIFIVDMIGITTLRELSPVITAIVIAGRSASSYTAQIGAMKITQEIDAMQTMGFDPFRFLVLPRVIALMIMLPILIFVSDMISVLAGIFIANIHLGISTTLFIDRFNEVVAFKHYLIGISKGPFFALLIASIGIYRGMVVKDDTQSIGINTTKSVVESIFAVIICDAIFSIIFTNLGI